MCPLTEALWPFFSSPQNKGNNMNTIKMAYARSTYCYDCCVPLRNVGHYVCIPLRTRQNHRAEHTVV